MAGPLTALAALDEAIVLCGGLGTRLRPVVSDVPKPMAQVAGRPFLDYVLAFLAAEGVRRVVLAAGYKADINVIDLARLKLHAPLPVCDLPAGGRRLTQKAEGYLATIVSGQVTYREGKPSGALPGRLQRFAREDAAIVAA